MPQVFLGNFDFEHELASKSYSPTNALRRLNAELSWHLAAFTKPGDGLWLPAMPSAEFVEASRELLGHCVMSSDLSEFRGSFLACPWGWSPQLRMLAERHRLTIDAPSIAATRQANSRQHSFHIEQQLGVVLPGAFVVTALAQLEAALRTRCESTPEQRWVIKSDFGMSGRERVVGCGPSLELSARRWIEKRLARHEWLIFEPWLDRVSEAGILLDVPTRDDSDAAIRLVALTELLTDARGQYAGTRTGPDLNATAETSWQPAVSAAFQLAILLRAQGYFGPLGIDAMQYFATVADRVAGVPSIRPIQDVNARWTMGFVAAMWAQRLAPGECSTWRLLPTAEFCQRLAARCDEDGERQLLRTHGLDLTAALLGPNAAARIVWTSPVCLGTEPTRHVGLLVSGATRDIVADAERQAFAS